MIDKLQLKTRKYPSYYCNGRIKNVWEIKVTEQYRIPFSIKRYKDEVTYNIVDMNVCHMLLERP